MNILHTIENKLWQISSPNFLIKSIRGLVAIFRLLLNSRLKLFASSLTYTTLLAIVPFLAILFSILKSFKIDKYVQEVINNVLAPMGQSGQEVGNYLLEFVNNAQAGLLGGIGILFLFYFIFTLFQKTEIALNHIWQVSEPRKLKNKIIGYLGALMLIVIITTLAIGLNIFSYKNSFLANLPQNIFLAKLSAYSAKLLSIFITGFLLAVLYSSIPNASVKFRAALIGGVFCALSWIPLTAIFAKIISLSSSYSVIYTSFASIVILLIWLNILWLLFLSGGLVSYFVQYPTLLRQHTTRALNPAELEYYAKVIMQDFIDHFNANKGEKYLQDIISQTQLTQHQVMTILAPFIAIKAIIKTREKENTFVLAMSEAQLSDEFIQQTIRGKVQVGLPQLVHNNDNKH